MWMRPTLAALTGLAAGYLLRGSFPPPGQSEGLDGSHPVDPRSAVSSGAPRQATAAPPQRSGQTQQLQSGLRVGAGGTSAHGAKDTAESSAQLQALRASQDEAKRRLSAYEQEIADLETSLGLRRTRHEFDLTAEDWTQLQRQGTPEIPHALW